MRAYVPDYELKVLPTLSDALQLMATAPGKWQPFAGGTDLMVLLEAGKLAHRQFVNLWHFPELRGIAANDDSILIGSTTTYTQIQNDQILQKEFPLLCRAASWTGSVAIQNRGTLGGNIANASPAADSLSALLVYDAEIELISAQGSRWIAYRDFHTGYKTSLRQADEIIKTIRLSRATQGWQQHTRKVGTRKAQAISKVCIAAMAKIENDLIADFRLAYGSVAPIPLRCVATENFLQQKKIDGQTIQEAREKLLAEISPIDDVRSTANYRAQVAANLMENFLGNFA